MKIIATLIFIAATFLPAFGQQSTPAPAANTTSSVYHFPTKEERFQRYVKSVVGPFSLLRTGFAAGIDQWRDSPDEWEQGASGFGKRYASQFGQNAINQTVVYGLDAALHQDTGFRKSTRKGFFKRAEDALIDSLTSRTTTGKRVISVPRFAGAYSSGIIAAETWYPSRYSYKDGLRFGTRSLASGLAINLFREFVFKF